MTWTLVGEQAVNDADERVDAVWGDDLALAQKFLRHRSLADEHEEKRRKTQAILCAHIEDEHKEEVSKRVFVPGENVVLTVVETPNTLVDLDAVRTHLKTAELSYEQWRALALAANNGWSRDKLKRHKALLEMLDKFTTHGWRDPYIRVDGVQE